MISRPNPRLCQQAFAFLSAWFHAYRWEWGFFFFRNASWFRIACTSEVKQGAEKQRGEFQTRERYREWRTIVSSTCYVPRAKKFVAQPKTNLEAPGMKSVGIARICVRSSGKTGTKLFQSILNEVQVISLHLIIPVPASLKVSKDPHVEN